MKIKKILLLTIFLFIFYSLNIYQYEHHIVKEFTALTIENIKKELKKLQIKHSDIVLKQIKLETGNLKYVENNNLFGFRGNNGYLEFNTWQESIEYKKRWQDKKYHGGNYYDFLIKVGYASDSTYIKKLKQFK